MPLTISSTNLFDETKAASLLDIKVATLRRWRWSGDGPSFIKVGAAVRYDPTDLEEFVNRNRRGSTSADQPPFKAA